MKRAQEKKLKSKMRRIKSKPVSIPKRTCRNTECKNTITEDKLQGFCNGCYISQVLYQLKEVEKNCIRCNTPFKTKFSYRDSICGSCFSRDVSK